MSSESNVKNVSVVARLVCHFIISCMPTVYHCNKKTLPYIIIQCCFCHDFHGRCSISLLIASVAFCRNIRMQLLKLSAVRDQLLILM